jgi:hypothetical protein
MIEKVSQLSVHRRSMFTRMVQGSAIALVLISLFLFGVDEPDPLWPKFWYIRPLVIVPIAGSMGGVFYYFMDHLRCLGGWQKWLAMVLSLIGYLISVWLGSVLGLDGTLWN